MKYHKSNFKSIGKLIKPLVKRHDAVSIISLPKLLNIWETVVGEEISKKARPVRMKTIKGGTKNILYLGMTGPYMAELSLQNQEIIEKINSYFSKDVIVQIKLQRSQDFNNKKLVELDKLNNFEVNKNEESSGKKLDMDQLEHALAEMKNNLNNSRKQNEIKDN